VASYLKLKTFDTSLKFVFFENLNFQLFHSPNVEDFFRRRSQKLKKPESGLKKFMHSVTNMKYVLCLHSVCLHIVKTKDTVTLSRRMKQINFVLPLKDLKARTRNHKRSSFFLYVSSMTHFYCTRSKSIYWCSRNSMEPWWFLRGLSIIRGLSTNYPFTCNFSNWRPSRQ
jgi:hypothetical protein